MITNNQPHQAVLSGIPYRLVLLDNCVTLIPNDGMGGTRITIYKPESRGLLYVAEPPAWSRDIPACHLESAFEIAEELLGPNHFLNLDEMHRFESRNAWKNVWSRRLPWRVFGLRQRMRFLWRAAYHAWMIRYRKPTTRIRRPL